MLAFFKRSTEVKNVEEEETEGFPMELLYEDDYFSVFKASVRDFVNGVETWSSQRRLKHEHVNKIVDSLYKTPHLK